MSKKMIIPASLQENLMNAIVNKGAAAMSGGGVGDPGEVDDNDYVLSESDVYVDHQDVAYGDPGDDIGDYDMEDDEDFEDLVFAMSSTGEPGIGGPLADFRARQRAKRQMRREQRRQRRHERRDKGQAMSNALNRAVQRSIKNEKTNTLQQTQIQKLHKRLKATEKVTIYDAYKKALLAAAQSIPGVRAYRALSGDHFENFIKYVCGIAGLDVSISASGDQISTATSPDGTSPFDAAAYKTVIDALIQREDELLTAHNNLKTTVYGIVQALQSVTATTTCNGLLEEVESDSLTDIAALLPSQFENMNAALLEFGTKYVVGTPSDSDGIELKFG